MKVKKRNYAEMFAFVAFVVAGFFLHFCNYDNSVFALDEYTENFFAQNNIYFYEPCETTESSDSSIKISGSSAEEKVWSGLTSFLSEEQAAGVMGNLNHESGLNPIRRQGDNTGFDIWSNNASNGWALGLAQWDGTRRPTMLNYVKGRDASLISLFDVSNYASSAEDFIAKAGHEKANKLYAYEIEFLKNEIDKSYQGLYNISGVSEAANWFCENVERPAACASSRATKAQEYYDKYAGKTIVGDGVNSAGSGVSSTTLTSSVHDKAWELANQTRAESMNGSTAAYTAAIKSVGGDKSSDACAAAGESCDMFVATVLRSSGVDTEVPFGSVSTQAEWFANHPEIYTEVSGDPSNVSTYQPGDIRIRDGHVEIFGEKDGKAYILSASHCERGAGYQDFFVESGYSYKIYRTSGKSSCYSSCSQGNMNINATAVCLAWPLGTDSFQYSCNGEYGSHGCTGGSPTEKFQTALDTVFPNRGWSACPKVGASCDVGVATVVRYSGVDTNFPRGLGDSAGGQRGWAKEHSDIWEILPFNKDDLQPGDIMYRSGHVALYVEDENGVGYTAESGLCSVFFHIKEGVSSNFENILRAKNAKNSTAGVNVTSGVGDMISGPHSSYDEKTAKSDDCDACAQDEDNGTGLKEGGMTLEEAKAWMESYANEASKKKRGSYSFDGALVSDAGCFGGTLNNCVAFSQWFLNKYTSIGPDWGNTTNGEFMVQKLGSTKGLKTGSEPRPYAVFSTGTYNHTGVVLGVTSDSVIVGEAGCNVGFVKGEWPGVREWSLEEAKSKKMTYAYTDDIININGL